jgi:hypothetical protein
MTVEHTWDGRAQDMIDEGKKQSSEVGKTILKAMEPA